MKRIVSLLLLLALCLSLCACGSKTEEEQTQQQVGAVDPSTGEWLGEGGCYRTELLELPEGVGVQFCREGQIYSMGSPSMGKTVVYRDGEELFRYEGMGYCLTDGGDGIWLQDEEREGGTSFARLTLFSYEGELQKQLRLELPPECFSTRMQAAGGRIYLNCNNSLRVYDAEGELICAIPHAEWQGSLLKGGDGEIYFCEERESGSGGTISAVDTDQGTIMELFVYDKGFVCCGDGESPFLQILPEGIYRMERGGETRPLVFWDECLLSVSGMQEAEALGDGRFLLGGSFSQPMLLVPAEPSDIKPKTMLTLAVLPTQDALDFEPDPTTYYANIVRSITAFNAQSSDCYVKLLDLSEGGSLTAEQALQRLNTQILSGEVPDMLVLNGSLSPFPFIRQGLLRDLRQDLEADPDMSLEDIVLADAICNDCGGLYVMTDCFSMETRLGLQSRFGETWGWSLDDYFRINAETPDGHMVIYNLTQDYFLRMSMTRYLREAIDWENGTCDFDNPEFIRVLEACRDMRATPEDPENMIFGVNLLGDGVEATDLVMIGDVTDLAKESRRVGQPVSVVGWPTPDGSCGSDFGFSYPIGVMKDGAHPELCWEFLKYCLLHAERGIPNYRPLMEKQIEEARHIDPDEERPMWYDGLRSPMTEEEIARFQELLRQVEHTELYDETAYAIIQEEVTAFLAGQRSAEETARIIQRRMSIYVSEQSG